MLGYQILFVMMRMVLRLKGQVSLQTVQAFQIETLLEAQAASERTYTQFLRVPALHAGIYTLPAQGQDTQNPHREDEVYYVLKGEGNS